MRRTWLVPIACLLPALASLVGAAPPAPMTPTAPAAPAAGSEDEQTLQAAKVGVDGPGLVAYLQQHTTPPAQQDHIRDLIRQLGDDSFKAREKASADLGAFGAAAVPYLRRALYDPDVEIQERAELLIKAAEGADARAAQSAAAARLIRRLAPPPADAAAVLVAYVPDADSDAVEEEVVASLAQLGVHDGKVDAPVVAALKDKEASRRAAAAVVVGRSGTAEQRADVQALLPDPDPHVRFRAAQGLLAGRDRAGVPALIDLTKAGPPDLAFRAAELLDCAVPHGPHAAYGDDDPARDAFSKAWAAWAQKNAKTVDLAHADCDLPAFNPVLRARDVVRQCFNALVQGDLALFKKTADAPFHSAGEPTFQTRDDLDRYFNENPMGIRNGAFAPLIVGTPPLTEYTIGSPATPATPEERAFVGNKYKPGDLAVFLVQQIQVGVPLPAIDPSQGNLFLVRLTGDQPRVIGISQNRQQIKSW